MVRRWLGLLALLCSACGANETSNPATDGGSFGGNGSHDGGQPDAMADADATVDAGPDGSVSPVFVGLRPTAAHPGSGYPTVAETLQAELTTYAAGVSGRVVALPWSDLTSPGLTTLYDDLEDYRQRGLRVVLNIMVVDRHLAHPPHGLKQKAWNDPTLVQGLQNTLDAVLTMMGSDLDGLAIGRDTDRYIEAHPEQSTALAHLLIQAEAHLDGYGTAAPLHGIGLSYGGTVDATAYYQGLGALGTATFFSYFPGLEFTPLPAAKTIAADLDEMIAMADGRPVYLTATGFTSNASLGSSAAIQKSWLEALFTAVSSRREHIRMFNVAQLHDLSPSQCNDYVTSQGYFLGGHFAKFACERGLRTGSGTPKPAWEAFLGAVATFASQ